MLRRMIKKTAGWLHALLLLSPLFPMLAALELEAGDIAGQWLFAKSLLILLPIIVTDYASEKCRNMLTYLVISIMTFTGTLWLGRLLSASFHPQGLSLTYLIFLALETAFVAVSRLMERLRRKEKEEAFSGADPSWEPTKDSLREPAFPVLFYFLALYAIALHVNSPEACNMAFLCASLYTPAAFAFQYVKKTEYYLSLNKRTCNLPSKRIYGIGIGLLLVFLLLFFLLTVLSVFTINERRYSDIRKQIKERPLADHPWTLEEEISYEEGNAIPEELLALAEEAAFAPLWMTWLSNLMVALTPFVLGFFLIKALRVQFRRFREARDENGDLVEELCESEPAKKIKISKEKRPLTERERIRKEYRKMIKYHRKERPAVYESPAEIEKNAGIAEREEVKKLHTRYEQARYGAE